MTIMLVRRSNSLENNSVGDIYIIGDYTVRITEIKNPSRTTVMAIPTSIYTFSRSLGDNNAN